MLFDEEILPKKSSDIKFDGTSEILRFHRILKEKEFHHSLLLPYIYLEFPELLTDFLGNFSKTRVEKFELKPNENGNILMEDLTESLHFARQTSFEEKKVIVIFGVCSLSQNVANALLKILEEPREGTFFLLIYRKKDLILPTIRSRSILIEFKNSRENFIFLYKNFLQTLDKEILLDLTGGNINLLSLFKSQNLNSILTNFNELLEDFSYLKFKIFFASNKEFEDLIFLLIEREIVKKKLGFYSEFLKHKKDFKLYNINFEAFLYYIMREIC